MWSRGFFYYQSVSICINLCKSIEIYINLWIKKTTSKLIEIVSCTPAGARTLDTLIKSQVLYQLSYKRILAILFSVRLQGLEPWTP